MQVESLIQARWVIPVEPAGEVLAQHAIAIEDRKIVAILPTHEAREQLVAKQTLELPDHALIPGLINAHTHAAMSLFRGLADDLPLMQWLQEHIWPAEKKWVDPEFIRDGTYIAIAEMLRGGISCFNDMYFYPGHTADIASQIGIRSVVGLIMIDLPSAWANNTNEYLSKGIQVYDRFKGDPLVSTTFAPHAPYTVSDHTLQRIVNLANELDIPIHMHIHETEDEITQGLQQYGTRPLSRLHQIGLCSERLIAVHMTQLEHYEQVLLAQHGVNIVHCPRSNLKLASGICPVQALLDQGINVCIGTDSAASNNSLDLLGEMNTASLIAKQHAHDSTALNAKTALSMATINGAKALGLDDKIGSLTVGKEADIVAIDLAALETQPIYDPISQIVYASSRHQISDVWVAGRPLLSRGRLLGLDPHALREKAKLWQARLSAH